MAARFHCDTAKPAAVDVGHTIVLGESLVQERVVGLKQIEHTAIVLQDAGYGYDAIREAPSFTEALVSKGNESTLIQWVQDSAFRFFPLCGDDELGLTLHPFDLALMQWKTRSGRVRSCFMWVG